MNFKHHDLPAMCSLLLGISLVIGASGCGASSTEDQLPRAAVRGTVTLDGEPLIEGVIRFIPQGKGVKSFATISGGEFEVDKYHGPVACLHRVEIESTYDGGYAADDETATERLKAANITRINTDNIPAIYNSHSTLTAKLSAGEVNELSFDLLSKPDRTKKKTK